MGKLFFSKSLFKGIFATGVAAFVAIQFLIEDKQMEEFARRYWHEIQPQLRSTTSLVIFTLIFIFLLFHFISQPIRIMHEPDTKEHIPNGKLLARAARSRKSGKIPPAYPTGWYRIEESSVLKNGEVKYIEFFGEHLVLYRGDDGTSAILDAYCPHLGANLAVDGKVVGNCIQCPFHGWQFQQDGKCTFIPYTDKVPEIAKTKAWPVHETNGVSDIDIVLTSLFFRVSTCGSMHWDDWTISLGDCLT